MCDEFIDGVEAVESRLEMIGYLSDGITTTTMMMLLRVYFYCLLFLFSSLFVFLIISSYLRFSFSFWECITTNWIAG